MGNPEVFDVVIIGGGPAGTSAAIRLLDLGHRVALVEQHVFPRPQIGESLSAGIRNIFDYLGAGHLLKERGYIDELPARVIWENAKEGNIELRNHNGGIMVDRGKLDHDLIQLAVSKGLVLFQPAKPEIFRRESDHWKVLIRIKNQCMELKTIFVLDSRGRSSSRMIDKIITTPPMVALYANTSSVSMPACTLIEAQENGWLWGSPLPGDKLFRMMAFFALADLRKEHPEKLFQHSVSSSLLFRKGLTGLSNSGIKSCVVLNYCHNNPWDNNYVRIGEAAFTLDPLSSSGVEKAMRFSLQTVIAVNNILNSGDVEISQAFFENHIANSIIQHIKWTCGYYHSAWPGSNNGFWKERSQVGISAQANETAFYTKLKLKLQESPINKKDNTVGARIKPADAIDQLWHKKVRISPQVTFTKAVCVENDRLQLKDTIRHPMLEREVAYIGNVAIFPLISSVKGGETIGELIYFWSRQIPFEMAGDILVRLCHLGLLEVI